MDSIVVVVLESLLLLAEEVFDNVVDVTVLILPNKKFCVGFHISNFNIIEIDMIPIEQQK